ncbi:hypothetical protein HK096_002277 [Nowakowskiella sp. JEL0078]|nr:hypothetical protein HK096_002277 [Nowakowskiella sp. JEL0078]
MTTEVLSSLIVKNLNDRFYERRKIAALDIEKLIRDSQAASDNQKVKAIITTLVNDFTYSTAPNAKNGGLIALAAVAIALGPNISHYCDDIVPPILSCLADPDTRVRYYACESMYNVVKIARTDILKFFNEIFDALSKLSADMEVSVKSGAELLDRLIKDIVAEATIYYNPEYATEGFNNVGVEKIESEYEGTSDYHDHPLAGPAPPVPGTYPLLPGMQQDTFNLPRFIPLLAERIHTRNPFTRMFLVQWIFTLDQIPDLELIAYLPDFLDGLFDFLSDPNVDVRIATLNVLGEFLKEIDDVIEIQKERGVLRIKGKNSQQMVIIKESATISEAKVSQGKAKLPSPPPYTQVARDDQTTEVTENSEFQEGGKDSFNSAVLATTSEQNSLSEENYTGHSYKLYEGVILDFGRMVDILTPHLSSSDEETQATALRWINDFILLAKEIMLPFAPMLINAILPSLAHAVNQIRNTAAATNANLYKLIWETPSGSDIGTNESTSSENATKEHFDYHLVVETLTSQFQNEHEETRIASMEWLLMLHRKFTRKAIDDTTFSALLKVLSDTSEEVVRRDLELLAQISQFSDSNYFTRFIHNLLTLFSTDRRLLETRGSLIIRQLCLSLEPERIYRTFSEILEKDEVLDLDFVSTMVQNLNIILITAPELLELRRRLRNLDSRDGTYLFTTLYKSWCHNPVAAFSLCLLAQAYEHAANLLQIFAELEMSVNFLIQIDKLVQLLESPVFTYLRLQLLEPDKYPHLFKCLYGILMLLPQSSAFVTLRNRLNSVSSMVMLYASNGYVGQNSMANQPQYVYTQSQANPTASVPQQTVQVKNASQQQQKSKHGSSPTHTSPLSSGTSYPQGLQQIAQQHNDSHLRWQELLVHFRGIQSQHEMYRRNGGRNSVTLMNQSLSRQGRPSLRGDVSAETLRVDGTQLESQRVNGAALTVANNPAPLTKSRPRSSSVSSSSSSLSSKSITAKNAGSQTNVAISINDELLTRPVLTSRSSGSSLLSVNSVPKREATSRSSGTAGNMVSGIVKKITGVSSLGSPSRK